MRVLVAVLLVAAACGDDGGDGSSITTAPVSTGATTVSTQGVTTTTVAPTSTTTEPPPAEYGDPILWIGGTDDQDLGHMARVDTATGELLVEIDLGSRPGEMVFGAGGLWVSDCWADLVYRLDPETGEVLDTVAVPGCPDEMVLDGGLLWVAAMGEPAVHRIDPATATVVDSTPLTSSPTGMARGTVWLSLSAGQLVHLGDDAARLSTIDLPDTGEDVTVGRGSVFGLDGTGTISRFDFEGNPMGKYVWRTDETTDDYSAGYCHGQLWSFTQSQVGHVPVSAAQDPDAEVPIVGVDVTGPISSLDCFGDRAFVTVGSGFGMVGSIDPSGSVTYYDLGLPWSPVSVAAAARTPSAGGMSPIVCDFLRDRVPAHEIDAATAHPQGVQGWGDPADSDRPPGPDNPPARVLTLADPSEPWDPVLNPLVYARTCSGWAP